MSRIEFMRELEGLLSDIPIEERNEAIQYYNDYFEDAGKDHEEEIIKELVSPVRIAGIIKADLNLSGEEHENRGYFTEKGYQDTIYTDEKYEIIRTAKAAEEENANKGASGGQTGNNGQSYSNYGNGYSQNGANHSSDQGAGSQNQPRSNNTNIALLILLAIIAVPIGIPMIAAIFGVFIGLIAAAFGILISFGVVGFTMVVVGIACFLAGIVQINIPLAFLLLCGIGLVVFGLGTLFLLSSVMICKKLIPAIFRGIVALCRLPFKNRSVTV